MLILSLIKMFINDNFQIAATRKIIQGIVSNNIISLLFIYACCIDPIKLSLCSCNLFFKKSNIMHYMNQFSS